MPHIYDATTIDAIFSNNDNTNATITTASGMRKVAHNDCHLPDGVTRRHDAGPRRDRQFCRQLLSLMASRWI